MSALETLFTVYEAPLMYTALQLL